MGSTGETAKYRVLPAGADITQPESGRGQYCRGELRSGKVEGWGLPESAVWGVGVRFCAGKGV